MNKHKPTMSLLQVQFQQHLVGALSVGAGDLRVSQSAGDLLAQGADRLLETRRYTRNQALRLHNMKRADRRAAADRSAFGTWLELAPLAPLDVSLGLLDRIACEIVMRGLHPMPHRQHANEQEERANHAGNLAQLRHAERMTAGSVYDLNDAMTMQREASRILSLAEAAHIARTISLPSV